MSKWDDEETAAAEPTRVGVSVGKKWDDEEDDDVLESWDAAEDSEEEREKEEKAKKAAEAAAALKKSKTQRIAEKQAENAAKKAAEEAEREARDDETPEERRRRMQQQEIEADLNHAVDLFAGAVVEDRADHGITAAGAAAASPKAPSSVNNDVKRKAIAVSDPTDSSKSIDLSTLPLFNPTTKKQFQDLQDTLAPLLAAHVKRPHYPLFVQELTRLLIKDMSSEQIRKVASTCTTLTNEKLREEKVAEKGGKKTKAQKTKTTLVGAGGKDSDRIDTKTYDDFGDDDFM